MEEKINISAILKDKPNGLRLYSPIFGDCTYCCVREDTNDICVKKHNGVEEFFDSKGLYYNTGEVMLFPSKEMRDWDKFAWKKGDALSCGVDNLCIFEKWANKEYTVFYAKFVTPNYSGNTFKTEKWSKETNEAVIKQYISNIEEFKGGKLNFTTLEIEKTQPEFKDGDILSIQEDEEHYHAILIFKGGTDVYVYFDYFHRVLTYGTKIDENEKSISHLATDEEKQQLFSALKKENKAWDADKKMFVDLNPKVELKPFEKVLVRDNEDDIWEVSLFGYKDELYYRCDNGIPWIQCIPYDGNEHLLGTTNIVEG